MIPQYCSSNRAIAPTNTHRQSKVPISVFKMHRFCEGKLTTKYSSLQLPRMKSSVLEAKSPNTSGCGNETVFSKPTKFTVLARMLRHFLSISWCEGTSSFILPEIWPPPVSVYTTFRSLSLRILPLIRSPTNCWYSPVWTVLTTLLYLSSSSLEIFGSESILQIKWKSVADSWSIFDCSFRVGIITFGLEAFWDRFLSFCVPDFLTTRWQRKQSSVGSHLAHRIFFWWQEMHSTFSAPELSTLDDIFSTLVETGSIGFSVKFWFSWHAWIFWEASPSE